MEARDRTGGRVCDENLSGVCVGKGAQIMNGCTNNPLAVMVQQVRSKKMNLVLVRRVCVRSEIVRDLSKRLSIFE